MVGWIVSHYRILEKLGEGGMGVVYKAEDTKLKRKVVLKFISPHLTTDKEATQRFEREAQAAAALNHPNIITIYEIGEFEGRLFIAMEYVEGESLRNIVGAIRESPLQTVIIDYATQICEGLSAAHQAGIIHRDIKPENILIDKSGRVKIADFGLARMKGVTKLTKDASTLGTLKYMSPEQCQNKEVDHRSDIWSFGVVLFEMLTGQLPFQGEYEAAVMYSVVNEQPVSVSSIRNDVPRNLEQIVSKALEKDPTMRYQSMQEVFEELKKPVSSIAMPEKKEKSIVVLPFVNMSPDPEQEYFSDGLTEEIITDLSHIHDLLVISRSSAMTFKGTKKTIPEIAQTLNVHYVLEGSVRKSGNNLRIAAQLIDAVNDVHIWADKFSGTLDDVFDIQEKVSRSIVDALKIRLSPEENKNISDRPILDAQAYELFLRARKESLSVTEEGLERALQLINNGLSIIGDNELLYGAMGWTYFQYFNFGIKKEERFLRKVEECVDKIFTLNPDSYMGHYLRSILHWKSGNIQDAINEFIRTLALNPNHVDSLMQISWFYLISGKSYAARPWLIKLIEIAPLDFLTHFAAGWIEIAEGRFEMGLKSLSKMYKLDPENLLCRLFYGHGLAYAHKFEEACKLFDIIVKESPKTWLPKLSLFFKYVLQNQKMEALQVVSEDLKKVARRDEYSPLLMAEGYALIEEKDEAIDWLDEVVKWGFINYPFLNEYDPFLENIRGEERFKKIMERVKTEWENFEV